MTPPDTDETRAELLVHRAEILRTARAHYARSGRGVLVAVHADGIREFVLYRAPGDLDAPDDGDGLAAIRAAVRAYDPESQAVVLVVDSAHDAFSCWRVGGTDEQPEAERVWTA